MAFHFAPSASGGYHEHHGTPAANYASAIQVFHAQLESLRAAAVPEPRRPALADHVNLRLVGDQRGEDPTAKASQRSQFFKTRYCPHYFSRVGFCKRGADCNYAHSEDELRPSVNLTKTKICQNFNAGACLKSAFECPFAHGMQELRATPSFYKSQLCKFWSTGHCPSGFFCRHAHGEEERIKKAAQLALEEGMAAEALLDPLYERSSDRHLTAPALTTPTQFSTDFLQQYRSDSLPEGFAPSPPEQWLQASASMETTSSVPSPVSQSDALCILKETLARRAALASPPHHCYSPYRGPAGARVASASAAELNSLFARMARTAELEGGDLATDLSLVLKEAAHSDRPVEHLLTRLKPSA